MMSRNTGAPYNLRSRNIYDTLGGAQRFQVRDRGEAKINKSMLVLNSGPCCFLPLEIHFGHGEVLRTWPCRLSWLFGIDENGVILPSSVSYHWRSILGNLDPYIGLVGSSSSVA